MKKLLPLGVVALLSCLTAACNQTDNNDFDNYITRDGHQLKDGQEVFRFAGIHAPELHRIEDDAQGVCKADKRGWGQHFKWPTRDEQENWIEALTLTGHKAMRVYVLSIEQEFDKACGRETHILKPLEAGGMPRLNEKAMVVYDQMLALAGEHQLRMILPFVDHWQWWGGREQLAAFYGEHADDFYNVNSKTYQAYLSIIEQVVNRTNTINGRKYNEDKTIMAWETGNELKSSTREFVKSTAAFIKQQAPNQLVVDGNYLSILPSSLADENVDIISNHFYTVNDNNKPETIKNDLTQIAGKKPYFVGEYGLETPEKMKAIMDAVVETDVNGAQAAGAFVWGFRGHRHDGGFYWHKEGNGSHYSYHLPGFVEGDSNNEIAIVDMVRNAQAKLAGLDKTPVLPVPKAPKLRAIAQDMQLKWLGAAVGRSYIIERKKADESKWQVIAEGVSDGRNRFDPSVDALFVDHSELALGATYEYRVIAVNESGKSAPSNVQSVMVEKPLTDAQQSAFVTVKDGQFLKDGKPYYFIGTNYWFGPLLGSIHGDRERLIKELDHLKSIGANNLRVLAGADGGNTDSSVKPALQYEQGKYNQELLEGLDFFLNELKKRDMVAVVYMNNNWIWSGGMSQYLAWNGYGEVPNPFSPEHSWPDYMSYTEQFHACKPCTKAYNQHVEKLVTRVNSISGIAYKDDPTIMSWQLANEPRVLSAKNKQHFKAWMDESVALIERLAPRQMISTGSEGAAGSLQDVALFAANHNNPDIDYLTMHVWPKNWSWYQIGDEQASTLVAIEKTKQYMNEHLAVAKAMNKPIVMSEFGFPRSRESLSPDAETRYRDQYFNAVFSEVANSKSQSGLLAGLNFWAYGGYGIANNDGDGIWQEGDDYLGDPAQEPQGLNTVFVTDKSTNALIQRFNKLLQQ